MRPERREAALWCAVVVLAVLLARTAYLYHDLNNLFWEVTAMHRECVAMLRQP